MRSPSLIELPPPRPGEAGWPWMEESRQLAENMSDGRLWSRISVVTPPFTQRQFLEETIRSVLL